MNKKIPENCTNHTFGDCCPEDEFYDGESCYCGDCIRCGGNLQ